MRQINWIDQILLTIACSFLMGWGGWYWAKQTIKPIVKTEIKTEVKTERVYSLPENTTLSGMCEKFFQNKAKEKGVVQERLNQMGFVEKYWEGYEVGYNDGYQKAKTIPKSKKN